MDVRLSAAHYACAAPSFVPIAQACLRSIRAARTTVAGPIRLPSARADHGSAARTWLTMPRMLASGNRCNVLQRCKIEIQVRTNSAAGNLTVTETLHPTEFRASGSDWMISKCF